MLHHAHEENPECPIASYECDGGILGGVHIYDTEEQAAEAWNRRAENVAPVVHTRWAHLGGDEWCCPVCGFVITTEGSWDKPTKKYCEDCGAKMDGGECE